MKRTTLWIPLSLAATGLAATGCKKDPPQPSQQVEESENHEAALDPDLAKAVAAASASALGPSSSAAPGSGPPPSGVLGSARADTEVRAGAAPKVTMGDSGAAPAVTFAAAGLGPGKYSLRVRSFQAEVVSGTFVPRGPGMAGIQETYAAQMPPLDLGLGIEVTAKAEPTPSRDVSIKLLSAAVDTARVAAPDPSFGTQVKQLKGSVLTYRRGPNGERADQATKLASTNDSALRLAIELLPAVLSSAWLEFPSEAVGPGGFFMVTTRELVQGMDTVAYRFVKVTSVDDTAVKLSIDIKRMAASEQVPLPGGGGTLPVQQFQGVGKAELTVPRGGILPLSGRLGEEITALGMAAEGAMPQVIKTQFDAVVEGSAPPPGPVSGSR